jgi:phosphoribosylaminoimidazolecarboxamide formyltransferase/IMP cyclohydrolase
MKMDGEMRIRSVSGGVLAQTPLRALPVNTVLKTSMSAPESAMADLMFAWKVVAHARSNAIVLAKSNAVTGMGSGQTSRVRALKIAGELAGEKAKGSVLASDAYFPFSDSVEEAKRLGVVAIIQPGGSIRDNEVIAKCEEYSIPLYFTGKRVFLH